MYADNTRFVVSKKSDFRRTWRRVIHLSCVFFLNHLQVVASDNQQVVYVDN